MSCINESINCVDKSNDDIAVSREVVRAAGEKYQVRSGDNRCQQPCFLRVDGHVVTRLQNQRGNCDLLEYLPTVASGMTCKVITRGGLGISSGSLHLVEMSKEFRVCVRSKKTARKHLPELGCIASPAFADQSSKCLILFWIVFRSHLGAPTVTSVENQVSNALRVFISVSRRCPTSCRYSEQNHVLCTDCA